MQARDVMISPVITVTTQTPISQIAQIFLERHISGAPVLDENGKLAGIISEGDLLHRAEAGTGRHRSWWLSLLTHNSTLAGDYIQEHARIAADVMTRDVITAAPETPVWEIARLMEKNRIKRVPIMEGGELVGIVSRANLIQAVAGGPRTLQMPPPSDQEIREKLLNSLRYEPWAQLGLVNITVTDGVVGLWGIVDGETERRALKVAAESIPGVLAVDDHLSMRPFGEG